MSDPLLVMRTQWSTSMGPPFDRTHSPGSRDVFGNGQNLFFFSIQSFHSSVQIFYFLFGFYNICIINVFIIYVYPYVYMDAKKEYWIS